MFKMLSVPRQSILGTCPSCKAAIGPSTDVCARCGWRFSPSLTFKGDPGTPGRTFVPASRPRVPVKVQLAIEVDRTGSSGAFKAGIQNSVEIITEQVEKKASALVVWVGTHGDLDYDERWALLSDGKAGAQARRDVSGITYGGGGDVEEHHLDGIATLLETVPWDLSSGFSRCLVAFLTADTKPARCGVTPRSLGASFKAKGVSLHLVCEATPALDELVAAACGLRFLISNNPSVSELQRVAAQVAASVVARTMAGGTKPLLSVAP